MVVNKSCKRKCNQSGVSKVLYLASVSLATGSFIIGCILLHLVVEPYKAEREFVETNCHFKKSMLVKREQDKSVKDDPTRRNCENKCSKETSKFPCLRITVTYRDVNNTNREGHIYDYYRTYAAYKHEGCASSPCNKRPEDNYNWVASFNRSLYNKDLFKCYYNQKKASDVLLHKLHPRSLMLHSVLWPTFICAVSIIVCIATWCLAGCSGWSQDVIA